MLQSSLRTLTLLLLGCGALARPSDSLAQEAYLKASNPDWLDSFSESVAIAGDTVVVGAIYEQSDADGVNGDQNNNGADEAGAAYVFVRDGSPWSQQAYLKASNSDFSDYFGCCVAVSGDTIVVGAEGERSNSVGVNGNQDDNSAFWAGAAYVFVRNGTTWSQQAYLKASNTDEWDVFGCSVAICGDTIVIGARSEDSSATGVNGNQIDNTAPQSGAAYVFVRNGTTWSQQAYLKASNTGGSDYFGTSVSISGGTIVVGANGEESSATGVNGNQSDNSSINAGAVYVFVRTGITWTQEAYVKASNTDAGDLFGAALSVSGDLLVIGAPHERSRSTGVNGYQGDNSALRAGAAYLFERSGTGWSQLAYLKASNTDAEDYFGGSVSAFGDCAVVGAPLEDSSATGVDGDQGDDGAQAAGAAYLFGREGTSWSTGAYLKASNTDANDAFGCSVGLSDTLLVVGASGESSGSTGVNGDQYDNGVAASGAAYVFDLELPPVGVAYCFGDPGGGTPCPCNNDNDGSVPKSGCANGLNASGAQLTGRGTASLAGDTLVLACTGLESGNAGLYFQANNDRSPGVPWGDGLSCAGGGLKRLQLRVADASGASFTTIGVSAKAGNIAAGDTKYYQCWYRNPTGSPCGFDFNASNGLAVTWQL